MLIPGPPEEAIDLKKNLYEPFNPDELRDIKDLLGIMRPSLHFEPRNATPLFSAFVL